MTVLTRETYDYSMKFLTTALYDRPIVSDKVITAWKVFVYDNPRAKELQFFILKFLQELITILSKSDDANSILSDTVFLDKFWQEFAMANSILD